MAAGLPTTVSRPSPSARKAPPIAIDRAWTRLRNGWSGSSVCARDGTAAASARMKHGSVARHMGEPIPYRLAGSGGHHYIAANGAHPRRTVHWPESPGPGDAEAAACGHFLRAQARGGGRRGPRLLVGAGVRDAVVLHPPPHDERAGRPRPLL